MKKEKTKVYIYTRVSTAMQVDGYSLDAQKSRMKAFAEYSDYAIAGEYEDAGKSGKSIEGRAQFSQMMEDMRLLPLPPKLLPSEGGNLPKSKLPSELYWRSTR